MSPSTGCCWLAGLQAGLRPVFPSSLHKQVLRAALSWVCLHHAVLPGMLVAMALLCKRAWQSFSPAPALLDGSAQM